MKIAKHLVKLPPNEPNQLDQNEAYFVLKEGEQELTLRFHDYAELFKRKGLYEQLYCDRLKCTSPDKVVGLLADVLDQNRCEMTELRVLDLGAGNGMVGELLYERGVARIVGVDICAEAYAACERDRPGMYDAYYLADLTELTPGLGDEFRSWHLDAMTSVAALGFGDIPPLAFGTAYNLIQPGGWIAFNIKETFFQASDRSGFSTMVRNMILEDRLELHHVERYRHRISMDGKPLYYYAIVGRKHEDFDLTLL